MGVRAGGTAAVVPRGEELHTEPLLRGCIGSLAMDWAVGKAGTARFGVKGEDTPGLVQVNFGLIVLRGLLRGGSPGGCLCG